MDRISQNLSNIQRKTGGPIDFDGINAAARADMVYVCSGVLELEGKIEGNEYSAINRARSDNSRGSFKIHTKGEKCGVWSDFATGDSGSDPISLTAYVRGLEQGEAAVWLAERLGVPARVSSAAPDNGLRRRNLLAKNDAAEKCVSPIASDSPPPTSHPELGKPTAVYWYHDQSGQPWFQLLRFDTQDGKKEFRQLSLWQDSKGVRAWRWKTPPKPWPLYNLHTIVNRPGAPVLY
jgi:hypothetical protein